MKKFILIALVLLIYTALGAEDKLLLSLSGQFLNPADDNYKEVYGKNILGPEFQLSYIFAKNWYAFGGYGFFSKKGETPELKEETKSLQSLLSLGAGYNGKISEKFGYFAQAGVVMFSYKEETMDTIVKGSAVGYRVDGGIKFKLVKKFSLLAAIGYLYGTDDADIGDGETASLKLGGFHLGIGFEFSLI